MCRAFIKTNKDTIERSVDYRMDSIENSNLIHRQVT